MPWKPFAKLIPFASASSRDFLSRRLPRIDMVVVGDVDGALDASDEVAGMDEVERVD